MWESIIGAVAGGLLGGGDGGGQQTASKEPWAPAQEWLKQNIGTGQNLQSYYQQNPFGAVQQGAYSNLLGQGDQFNQMMPGLLSQIGRHQGFDRRNPSARPQPFAFNQLQAMQPMRGLLGAAPSQGPAPQMNAAPANPYMLAPPAPPPAPAPAMSIFDPDYQRLLDADRGMHGA